jgi:hypothetical protein
MVDKLDSTTYPDWSPVVLDSLKYVPNSLHVLSSFGGSELWQRPNISDIIIHKTGIKTYPKPLCSGGASRHFLRQMCSQIECLPEMYSPRPGGDSFVEGMEAVGRQGDAAVDRGRLPEPSPSSAVAVVATGGTSSASEYCFELLDL